MYFHFEEMTHCCPRGIVEHLYTRADTAPPLPVIRDTTQCTEITIIIVCFFFFFLNFISDILCGIEDVLCGIPYIE